MNIIKKMKLTKKKTVIISVAAVVILALVTGSILVVTTSGTTTETEDKQPSSFTGNKGTSNMEDMVSSTGYAVYGTIDQTMDVTIDSKATTDYLTIESVEVSKGDTVSEGDVLFTVTSDSYKAAKAYLEEQLNNAENKLAQEELSYKQAVLDAEYERLNDSQLADSAKVEYEDSVNDLKEQVADAKTAYNEALTAISKNPSTIKTNKSTLANYNSKLKTIESSLKKAQSSSATASDALSKVVSEYKTILYTYKYLLQLQNGSTTEVDKIIAAVEQGTTVTTGDSGNGGSGNGGSGNGESNNGDSSTPGGTAPNDGNTSGGNSPSGTKPMSTVSAGNVNQDNNLLANVKSKCESLASTYASAKSTYDTAAAKVTTLTTQKTSYTSKISTLEQKNEQLQSAYDEAKSNVTSLKSKYNELINQQEAQLVTLKKTYQLNVLTSETAQSTYDKTISSLDESLQTYKDALTTAQENLNSLTSAFTDCQFKANQSGTVATVNYAAGDIMANGVAPISYQDSSAVTVTVAVSQEDIGSLNVGDSATIMDSTSSGRYTGTIQEIGAESSSDSVTNVTYNVVITLTIEEGTTISTTNSLSVVFGDFAANMSGGNRNQNQNNADSSQEGAQNEN